MHVTYQNVPGARLLQQTKTSAVVHKLNGGTHSCTCHVQQTDRGAQLTIPRQDKASCAWSVESVSIDTNIGQGLLVLGHDLQTYKLAFIAKALTLIVSHDDADIDAMTDGAMMDSAM